MANLFSSSLKSQPSSLCCYHCVFISCRNVSPKYSKRLQFCNAIPCFAKRWVTHHSHMISRSNEASDSSSNSVSEDFDIVSATGMLSQPSSYSLYFLSKCCILFLLVLVFFISTFFSLTFSYILVHKRVFLFCLTC